MSRRHHQYRPAAVALLEGRVVLSHLAVTHKATAHPAHATPSLPTGISIDGTSQTKYSDGRVETSEDSYQFTGPQTLQISTIVRSGNQILEVDQEKATDVNGVLTFTTAIDKSIGGHQTETGTEVLTHSAGTIQLDGTVGAGSGLLSTTTIKHVLTQAGLGTQTTVGTEVSGSNHGKQISVTDEVVTNFDGSQDHVHILSRSTLTGPIVKTTTTTHPDGTTTTLVATTKILSAMTL